MNAVFNPILWLGMIFGTLMAIAYVGSAWDFVSKRKWYAKHMPAGEWRKPMRDEVKMAIFCVLSMVFCWGLMIHGIIKLCNS